jgi:zinc protease
MKRLCLLVLAFLVIAGVLDPAVAKTPIRVTEIPSAKSPLISIRIVLRAGAINDVKGKEGINALTALMIAQGGTQELKFEDVMATLYPWAAGIGVQPDEEITTFVANVHRDHLEKFYPILTGLLLHPRFDPDDFTRNKDAMLNGLEKDLRGTDDENLGKDAMLISLFANHPYGTAGSTVQGLKSTSLEDVKEYYRRMYTTGNIWIGLAGGYPKSLVERMKKDFSTLPDGKFTPVTLPKPAQPKGLEIDIVQKPARAVAISIGHPLPLTRKDKDFYALLVANSYFGEHRTFNGVLMNRLRGDRGLNYGDYSYIERFLGGTGSNSRFPMVNTPLRQQYFSIWLRPVPPEKAHFALRAALYELNKFVENGLTKEDFEATRKFLLNYSKLWAQTLDRRLGYAMDAEFYGMEGDYIQRIDRELKALTVDDVNRAIRKYISATNLKVAVVTEEGEKMKEALLANTPSPITYASPVSERILEEDKAIAAFPLSVNAAKTRVVPVNMLFENESPGATIERKDIEVTK